METVARFMALFAGLDRAYGTYKITTARSDGKQTGEAVTKRAPVTTDLWQKHLSGDQGLGVVPIRDDCSVVFGAVDVDAYQNFDPASVAVKIKALDLPLVTCRSKSGGAHLYLFASEPVEAGKMRARLSEIAAMLGHGQCEIFPKQSKILADRGDIGGWINMPYFGGVRGMRYAVKPGGDAMEPEEFLDFAEASRQGASFFDTPVTRGTGSDWIPDGPPCLQCLAESGVPEGGRNDAMFSFGLYAKKAFPDAWAAKLEEFNRLFFHPPLTLDEIRGTTRSLSKKDYNYPCQKPPISLHCNVATCRTRKHGVGQGGGASPFPILGELRKLTTNPPIWFWDVDSQSVEMTTEQLQNPRMFQKRCMEILNRMPVLPSNTVWQQLVQQAMDKVVKIDAPDDSSLEGLFWEYLEKFCTGLSQAQSRDEMIHGKPWSDDEGMTWFRMTDLLMFLERQHFREMKPNKITAVLKDKGAVHDFFKIKNKGFNVWGVPRFKEPDEPLDVPDSVKQGAPF